MTIRHHLAALVLATPPVGLLAIALACGSAETPPASAATPPAATDDLACHKDADCKGDRICDEGKCVAPPR